MSITSVQLDRELLDKAKIIVKKKKPLRKINSYAEATREILYDYIKKNKRFLKEEPEQNQLETATEESN